MLFYGVCFGCHGRDDLSLLVKLDGLFELVETGSIAVHVHEGLVALPEGSILAFHGLNLSHAACLNHIEVGLDAVAYDQNGPNGLDPGMVVSTFVYEMSRVTGLLTTCQRAFFSGVEGEGRC